MSMAEDESPAAPGAIKELAMAIEKLESAASKNEARDALIRKQAREEAAQELTEQLKNDGISEELEASIKRILIGK